MFNAIQIMGYRGLPQYQLRDLGRVNLLVGKNNSGKTSVLEAAYVLGAAGEPMALWRICDRRGERLIGETDRLPRRAEVDISHLFTGHDLVAGRSFSVEGQNRADRQVVTVSVDELPEAAGDEEPELILPEEGLSQRQMSLRIRSSTLRRQQQISLTRQGGLELRRAELASSTTSPSNRDRIANVHFVSTDSLAGNELIRHWDRIQLTPDESLVLQALRFVDDSIEQIRSFGAGSAFGPRGGFIVKRRGERSPIPLGSLGDGAWHMLTLAIILTQCAGGMLFIDEIDTGLHFTVMTDMWRLVHAASKQFDIQVFASTHSYDCVHSLSAICRAETFADGDVTIQRIEADKPVATSFSEAEIRTAADRQIEIR
jgi:hypothetical protein